MIRSHLTINVLVGSGCHSLSYRYQVIKRSRSENRDLGIYRTGLAQFRFRDSRSVLAFVNLKNYLKGENNNVCNLSSVPLFYAAGCAAGERNVVIGFHTQI